VDQVEPLACTGDADVGETPLLLELVGIAEAPHVREHAVFETGENTTGTPGPWPSAASSG
jgi:hypothetical protein